jgi:2-polyprenyl-3-methyl-5-hydroxy-6-metoxy-1,4-benzoquinol methylase
MSDNRPDPPTCPICGHRSHVSWLLDKDGWRLFRCRPCDHIFVFPQPSPDELRQIYSFESGYHVELARRPDQGQGSEQHFLETLAQIRRHVTGGTLLDVGCAAGQFMLLAKAAGFAARGVELNPGTAAIARGKGFDVAVGPVEDVPFEPTSFDVVHMGDVIEHVRDPAALLRRVRGLLKTDGLVAVVTPIHDAFFPRTTLMLHQTLGIPWSHPTPPHHLHQFSTRSLASLLAQTGFGVCHQRYTPYSLLSAIRDTGVVREAKRRVREGRPLPIGAQAIRCLTVGLLYGLAWAVDHSQPIRRADVVLTATARLRRPQ